MSTCEKNIEDDFLPDLIMARDVFCNHDIHMTEDEMNALLKQGVDFSKINPMPYLRIRNLNRYESDDGFMSVPSKSAIEVGLKFSF